MQLVLLRAMVHDELLGVVHADLEHAGWDMLDVDRKAHNLAMAAYQAGTEEHTDLPSNCPSESKIAEQEPTDHLAIAAWAAQGL